MLVTIVLTAIPFAAQTTFTQDGFTFQTLNSSEVKITGTSLSSGDLIIPEETEYNGVTYKVVEIGRQAFYKKYNYNKFTSVTFPESLNKIGDEAFLNNYNLTTVSFPSHLQSIGESAFGACRSLKEVNIEDVDTIGERAFEVYYSSSTFRSSLERISINKCRLIASQAFYISNDVDAYNEASIKNLEVYIGSGRIESDVFLNQKNLRKLTLGDGVTYIGRRAFQHTLNLESVTIGNSVDTIAVLAFSGCSKVQSLSIPASVTMIGQNAFYGWTSLKDLSISDGDKPLKIGYASTSSSQYGMFQQCPLSSLYIGRSVTYTTYPSFYKIKTLKSVEFGGKVTSIPNRLFADDDSIAVVRAPWTTPVSINENVFSDNAYSNATLYIPKGSTDNYEQATGWQKFISKDDGRSGQSITWEQDTVTVGIGKTLALTATASSGEAVTYSITDGADLVELVQMDGGIGLKGLKAGSVTVKAEQAGNTDYKAAEAVSKEFTVVKNDQDISWALDQSSYYVGDTISLDATASSGLDVTYSFPKGGDLVSLFEEGGKYKVVCLKEGTVTIQASQSGDDTFNAAAEVSKEISIGKYAQSITWDNQPISLYVGSSVPLTATSSSGLAVTYEITGGSTNATIEYGDSTYVLKGLKAGTVTITASQSGNDTYNSAGTVSKSFIINNQLSQTITWTSLPPTSINVGDSITLEAVSSASLPISYSVTEGSDLVEAKVDGTTFVVKALKAGTVVVTATQSGSDAYSPAEVTSEFNIVKRSQSITWTSQPPTSINVGDSITLEAVSSASLPVSYSVTEGSELVETKVNGTALVVKALKAGTVVITATQSGNDAYSHAEITSEFNIVKRSQSITWTLDQLSYYVGDTISLDATASSGMAVTYSFPKGADQVSLFEEDGKSKVLCLKEGAVTIQASQPGDDTFGAAAEVSKYISIGKHAQSITWTCQAPTSISVGDSITLEAVSSASLPISYSVTEGPDLVEAKVDGTTFVVKALKAGTVVVTATQSGSDAYSPAEITSEFNIVRKEKRPQTVTWTSQAPTSINVGDSITLEAVSSASLPISYSVTTGSDLVETKVDGTTLVVKALKKGTVVVTATQSGNEDYASAEITFGLSIIKGKKQTITWNQSIEALVGQTVKMTATASSGLPVVYDKFRPQWSGGWPDSEIHGDSITFTNAGARLIVATQAGNEEYEAAEPDTLFFNVLRQDEADGLMYIDGIYYKYTDDSHTALKVVRGYKSYQGEIVIPDVVDSLGLPVTKLEDNALYSQYRLRSIEVSNNVTEYGSEALGNNPNLEKLVLPANGASLPDYLCNEDAWLKEIHCRSTVPYPGNTYVFDAGDSFYENCVLYVPTGTMEAYRAADPWKNFIHIVEEEPTGIKGVTAVESSDGYWYTLQGVRLTKRPTVKGVYIHHGKKVVIMNR